MAPSARHPGAAQPMRGAWHRVTLPDLTWILGWSTSAVALTP